MMEIIYFAIGHQINKSKSGEVCINHFKPFMEQLFESIDSFMKELQCVGLRMSDVF